MNKIKVFILLLLVIGGCSEKKEITMRSSPTGQTEGSPQAANIEKIPSFVLTWNAAEEDLSAYHIYFTSDGTNVDGVEINSLLPNSPDFKAPKFTVSNKEFVLNGKKQACFYIIADHDGLMSPASDAVCAPIP